MKGILKFLLVLMSISISHLLVLAQDKVTNLDVLIEDNKEDVYALALYPDEMRSAILETTLHPEILVKLQAIQSQTSEEFQKLIQYLPEEDQKKYWELTRHDGLLAQLIEGGQKNSDQIRTILEKYPEEIHKTALEFGVQRYKTLESIYAIIRKGDLATVSLLAPYSDKTQLAVQTLIDNPEVLFLLNQNLELVVLVGDAYSKNPKLVLQKADSIRAEASRSYAEDIANWKKGLEENPEALNEFEQVSASFSENNNYVEYDPMYPDLQQAPNQEKIEKAEVKAVNQVDVYYYHYPFWLGYPYWYPTTYWYWYPYWYHWGYYYDYDHTILVLGLPSYYFVSWYFSVPYHHYLYPHFSDYIIRHYRRSPAPSRSGLYTAVQEWETRNNNAVTRAIVSDDRRRVERLKEYGLFETEYLKRAAKVNRPSISRELYLDEKRRQYPNLSGKEVNTIKRPETIKGRTIKRSTSPYPNYQINRARDLHQRIWDRSNFNLKQTPTQRRPISPSRSRTIQKKRN